MLPARSLGSAHDSSRSKCSSAQVQHSLLSCLQIVVKAHLASPSLTVAAVAC